MIILNNIFLKEFLHISQLYNYLLLIKIKTYHINKNKF